MDDLSFKNADSNVLKLVQGGSEVPGGIEFWLCTLIGIAVTALLFVITDYYTSTRFRPVKTTASASQTGHATNIIQGLAQGFQATAAPAIVLALGILGANGLAGIYGVGVAVMAQLSLTGLIVALDAFVVELDAEAASEGERVNLAFSLSDPEVLVGLLIGGMMVNLFAALAIESVGRAGGGVVEEVRDQFNKNPGIMEGTV